MCIQLVIVRFPSIHAQTSTSQTKNWAILITTHNTSVRVRPPCWKPCRMLTHRRSIIHDDDSDRGHRYDRMHLKLQLGHLARWTPSMNQACDVICRSFRRYTYVKQVRESGHHGPSMDIGVHATA